MYRGPPGMPIIVLVPVLFGQPLPTNNEQLATTSLAGSVGYITRTSWSARWSSISVVCVAKIEMRSVPSLGRPGQRGM